MKAELFYKAMRERPDAKVVEGAADHAIRMVWPDALPDQIKELKLGFMMGFFESYSAMMEISALPLEQADEMMSRLSREAREWLETDCSKRLHDFGLPSPFEKPETEQ